MLSDAGSQPVGLMLEERTRRVDHVETAKEHKGRLAGRYVWAPRYDFIGTGRLRLHVTDDDRKTGRFFEGTATTRLEDTLAAVLGEVAARTVRRIELTAEIRRRQEEAETSRREEERLGSLRAS